MYTSRRTSFLLLLILFGATYPFTLFAQEVLTLNDALKIALENNYAIQVAKNDAALAKNNNQIGAAGMLPVVTGTATEDQQKINSHQQYLNGTENNRTGAKNKSLAANVELGWTIFDGFKMFATKNRLGDLQQVGELRMRSNIELIFVRVTKAYYDVMLSKQQLKVGNQLLESSTKRLEFAEAKYKGGKTAKTEWLRAQVDLNTDKANMMRAENTFKNAKSTLNQILARDLNTPYDVPDTVTEYKVYQLSELTQKATTQNAGLLVAKKNQEISMLSIREIQAERMPNIQLRGGYNYNKQESQAGFLQSSQIDGYHYGAGLNINIFNGFDVNRRLQNAKLNRKTSDLVYKDSLTKVENAITQAYNNYVLSTQLISFERENVNVAQQNFDIADDQYKVGVITSLELRDAQTNLLNSQLRLLNAHYEAKLNETELLRLCGELVKF